jgi:hypothetical protein
MGSRGAYLYLYLYQILTLLARLAVSYGISIAYCPSDAALKNDQNGIIGGSSFLSFSKN